MKYPRYTIPSHTITYHATVQVPSWFVLLALYSWYVAAQTWYFRKESHTHTHTLAGPKHLNCSTCNFQLHAYMSFPTVLYVWLLRFVLSFFCHSFSFTIRHSPFFYIVYIFFFRSVWACSYVLVDFDKNNDCQGVVGDCSTYESVSVYSFRMIFNDHKNAYRISDFGHTLHSKQIKLYSFYLLV